MIKSLRKSLFIPSFDLYNGQSISKHLTKLEKLQWVSTEELKDLQGEKLRFLINHAYKNVPYYHTIFKKSGLKPEDIKTAEDLGKIPI